METLEQELQNMYTHGYNVGANVGYSQGYIAGRESMQQQYNLGDWIANALKKLGVNTQCQPCQARQMKLNQIMNNLLKKK